MTDTQQEVTLVALDLSEYVIEVDTPEVAALKRKVQKVADKYTNRHGWCSEVKAALAEIGIAPPPPVKVDLTLHPLLGGAALTVEVDPTKLVGKDVDQQRKVLAKNLNDIRAFTNGRFAKSLELTPDAIIDMVLQPKPDPNHVDWVRISAEGRALHVLDERPSDSRYVGSLCGRAESYRSHMPATNGSITKHCVACTKAVERRATT